MASPVQVLLAEALALAQGNPKTLELREEEGSVRLALELREPSARNPMDVITRVAGLSHWKLGGLEGGPAWVKGHFLLPEQVMQ